MIPTVTTLISYSVGDKQFLRHCLEHAKPFSREVIVSYCDHYFDGLPINENDLRESEAIIRQYHAIPILFHYKELNNPEKGTVLESRWLNNYQRYVAWKAITAQTDFLLWLDTDEIVDTNVFTYWLEEGDINERDSYSLSSYWYWREPIIRSTIIESNTILSRSNLVMEQSFFRNPAFERENFLGGKQQYCKKGPNDSIFIHHYSWVRNKEQMLRKVASWSHNKDDILLQRARQIRNVPSSYHWKELVDLEFANECGNRDFVNGNELVRIGHPYINLS